MARTESAETLAQRLARLRARIEAASAGRPVRLVAASKAQPAARIAELAAAGHRDFGENYLQEAQRKQAELAGLSLIWHFIGPIQSNKCRDIARHFDWVHGIDREKLIEPLGRERDPSRPLEVLIQVKLDDEDSKSGCRPEQIAPLAERIAEQPGLRLRGLMAIPKPWPELERRTQGFRQLAGLFDALRRRYPHLDTLSLGMSEDFEQAIAAGSTLVRLGTALFGPRPPRPQSSGNPTP